MYTEEIESLIFGNNGVLTKEQFEDIYENSSQLIGCLYSDGAKYRYEFWLSDKIEPLLFNVNPPLPIEKNYN